MATDTIGLCICGHPRRDHWLHSRGGIAPNTEGNGACIQMDECGCQEYSPALYTLTPRPRTTQNHQEAHGGPPRVVAIAVTAAAIAAVLGLALLAWRAFCG